MTTKVKKSIGHDRMTFSATFDNGDVFKFNISRSGDRFSASQKVDVPQVSSPSFNAICKYLALNKGEVNSQRFERAEAQCLKATSLESLAALCK